MRRINDRCVYCGYAIGDTTDHILPRSVISDINYYRGNNFPIISANDPRNKVGACLFCNRTKANIIMLPTVSNIYKQFKHYKPEDLSGFADYLYENKDAINYYITEEYIYMNDYGLWQPRMRMVDFGHQMKEFELIYEKGYFKDIDVTLETINL